MVNRFMGYGYGGDNALNPQGQQFSYGYQNAPPQGYQATAPAQPAENNYPAWLTDVSARGLASDWAPAAQVAHEAVALESRAAPVEAPPPPAPMTDGFGGAGAGFGSGGPEGGSGGPNAEGPTGSPGDTAESGASAGPAGGGVYYHGGLVTQANLLAPNPPGPDTGYASLQAGEGVMTKKAMKFYGADFLSRLNKLTVPKGD